MRISELSGEIDNRTGRGVSMHGGETLARRFGKARLQEPTRAEVKNDDRSAD